MGHLPLLSSTPPARESATISGTPTKEDLSLAEVFRQLDDTHQRLIDLIERVPEDQLIRETRFRWRLRLDTYGHYPKHGEAIRRWRTA